MTGTQGTSTRVCHWLFSKLFQAFSTGGTVGKVQGWKEMVGCFLWASSLPLVLLKLALEKEKFRDGVGTFPSCISAWTQWAVSSHSQGQTPGGFRDASTCRLVSILWKLFYLVNEPILEQHFNKKKCMWECVCACTGVCGMCTHAHHALCVKWEGSLQAEPLTFPLRVFCGRTQAIRPGSKSLPVQSHLTDPSRSFFSSN